MARAKRARPRMRVKAGTAMHAPALRWRRGRLGGGGRRNAVGPWRLAGTRRVQSGLHPAGRSGSMQRSGRGQRSVNGGQTAGGVRCRAEPWSRAQAGAAGARRIRVVVARRAESGGKLEHPVWARGLSTARRGGGFSDVPDACSLLAAASQDRQQALVGLRGRGGGWSGGEGPAVLSTTVHDWRGRSRAGPAPAFE